jgi:type 2 lantibiotic biosynthesis protein LanM
VVLPRWCTAQGIALPDAVPTTLDCGDHGWVQYVPAADAALVHNERQTAHATGALLALLSILGATDCHAENVRISAGVPYLLDAELLLDAAPQPTGAPSMALRTGMLPFGLSPDPAGLPPAIAQHVAELETGFTRTYRQIMAQRHRVATQIQRFDDCPQRYPLRATADYAAILHDLAHPHALGQWIDREITTMRLWRTYLHDPARMQLHPLLPAERTALIALDFPRFHGTPAGTTLHAADGTGVTVFPRSAADQAQQRLAELSASGCAHERVCLRAALPQRWIGGSVARTDLAAQAAQIGQMLRRSAVATKRGLEWFAVDDSPGSGHAQVQTCGWDLYQGTSGIALFFAALAQTTGEARWRKLGLDSLRSVQRDLHAGRYTDAPLGGTAGLGGLLYMLIMGARWLAAPELLRDAHHVAALMTSERMEAAPPDLSDGIAGALLGLLALAHTDQHAALVKQAQRAGAILVAQQHELPGGAAWIGPHDSALLGMAHGAAGIAYALHRLAAVDGDQRWQQAAAAAFAYLQHHVDVEQQAWPDRRTPEPIFLAGWCNGAAGIGMAHLGAGDARARNAISAALAAITTIHDTPLDHLCCGRSGKIELLLVAAERLQRPDLHQRAVALAQTMCDEAHQAGTYRLFDAPDAHLIHPGFFRGLAGIGYTLLRTAHPGRLPCVALWEPA